MSLVTPDFGLLVWMTLIFSIVLFILARWGFPVITSSVRKRTERIEEAVRKARETEERLKKLSVEEAAIIERTKREQNRILRETADFRDLMFEQAKEDAKEQSEIIIARAKEQVNLEKENALREIRSLTAVLSVEVARKILLRELSDDASKNELLSKLIDQLESSPELSASVALHKDGARGEDAGSETANGGGNC